MPKYNSAENKNVFNSSENLGYLKVLSCLRTVGNLFEHTFVLKRNRE